MTQLFHIAERTLNRPLLILPEKLSIIGQVLSGRIGLDAARTDFAARDPDEAVRIEAALASGPTGSRFVGESVERDEQGRPKNRLPYRRTPEGVALITITGSLVNRGAWIGASSGLTSYEGIAHQVETAVCDPKVKSIILDIDSPGGEAVGAFETAALIRKAGEAKPIAAMVNGMACSAAYALASGCKMVASSESGLSGSIGVVLMHADYSRAVYKAGITPTFIHAGAHKVDGNPYEPLSKSVRGDLQAEVDKYYALFLDTVAAGRGKRLSAQAARATEARTFIGQAAKDAGLVDEIGAFADLIGALSSSPGARRSSYRSMKMFDQDDLDRAKAQGKAEGLAEGKAAGLEEGAKAGASAERERIKAILAHPEAQGRETAAQHMALNSELSVEMVAGVLAGVPKASSIGARQSDVLSNVAVDTGEGANAGAPAQNGAVAWDDIASRLNAEARRTATR